MNQTIQSQSAVKLGVVPTHLKFDDGLVPDENGRLPRDSSGQLVVAANMKALKEQSRFAIDCVQIPSFPGINAGDVAELVQGLKALGMDVHYILMVGGADPMNPLDESKVVDMLVGLRVTEESEREGLDITSHGESAYHH